MSGQECSRKSVLQTLRDKEQITSSCHRAHSVIAKKKNRFDFAIYQILRPNVLCLHFNSPWFSFLPWESKAPRACSMMCLLFFRHHSFSPKTLFVVNYFLLIFFFPSCNFQLIFPLLLALTVCIILVCETRFSSQERKLKVRWWKIPKIDTHERVGSTG